MQQRSDTDRVEVSLVCMCGKTNMVAPLAEILRLALAGIADRECGTCGQRNLDLEFDGEVEG